MLKRLLYLYNDGHNPFPKLGKGGLGYHLPQYRKRMHGEALHIFTNDKGEHEIIDDGNDADPNWYNETNDKKDKVLFEADENKTEKESKKKIDDEDEKYINDVIHNNLKKYLDDFDKKTKKYDDEKSKKEYDDEDRNDFQDIHNIMDEVDKIQMKDKYDDIENHIKNLTLDYKKSEYLERGEKGKKEDEINKIIIDRMKKSKTLRDKFRAEMEEFKKEDLKKQLKKEEEARIKEEAKQQKLLNPKSQSKKKTEDSEDVLIPIEYEVLDQEQYKKTSENLKKYDIKPESFDDAFEKMIPTKKLKEIDQEKLKRLATIPLPLRDKGVNEKGEYEGEIVKKVIINKKTGEPVIDPNTDKPKTIKQNLFKSGKDTEKQLFSNDDLLLTIINQTYGKKYSFMKDPEIVQMSEMNEKGEYTTFDAIRCVVIDDDNNILTLYIEAKKYDNSMNMEKQIDTARKEYEMFIANSIGRDMEIIELDDKIDNKEDLLKDEDRSEKIKSLKKEIKELKKARNEKAKAHIKPIDQSNNTEFSRISTAGAHIKFTKFDIFQKELPKEDPENPDTPFIKGQRHIQKLQSNEKRVTPKTRAALIEISKNPNKDILYVVLTDNCILSTSQREFLKRYKDITHIAEVAPIAVGPYEPSAIIVKKEGPNKGKKMYVIDHFLMNLHNLNIIDTNGVEELTQAEMMKIIKDRHAEAMKSVIPSGLKKRIKEIQSQEEPPDSLSADYEIWLQGKIGKAKTKKAESKNNKQDPAPINKNKKIEKKYNKK